MPPAPKIFTTRRLTWSIAFSAGSAAPSGATDAGQMAIVRTKSTRLKCMESSLIQNDSEPQRHRGHRERTVNRIQGQLVAPTVESKFQTLWPLCLCGSDLHYLNVFLFRATEQRVIWTQVSNLASLRPGQRQVQRTGRTCRRRT